MPPPERSIEIEEDSVPTPSGARRYWIHSPFQLDWNPVEVLVPDAPPPPGGYRVAYALPVQIGPVGKWGCPVETFRADALHERHRCLLVAPSFADMPWLGDQPAPPMRGVWVRQRRHLLEAVLPAVEARHPVRADREGRVLIGFSKSAPGALATALEHSDLFGGVGMFDNADPDILDERFEDWGLRATYGDRDHYVNTGPLAGLKSLSPSFTPPRVVVMSGGTDYRGVNVLRREMENAGLPHLYRVHEGMPHDWRGGWLPELVGILLEEPRP